MPSKRKTEKLEIADIIDPDEYILVPEDVYFDLRKLCKKLKISEQEGLRRSIQMFLKSSEKKDEMVSVVVPTQEWALEVTEVPEEEILPAIP